MDASSVYLTDYLRTFKYPFSDIKSIEGIGLMPNRVFHIELKAKGTFGKHIYFLASQKLWKDFVDNHPEQMKNIFILKPTP